MNKKINAVFKKEQETKVMHLLSKEWGKILNLILNLKKNYGNY